MSYIYKIAIIVAVNQNENTEENMEVERGEEK